MSRAKGQGSRRQPDAETARTWGSRFTSWATKALLPVAVMLWLGGCGQTINSEITRLPDEFSVVTFNVLGSNNDVAAIRSAVLSSNPLIVAFQEYQAGTHRGLREALRSHYPYQRVCPFGVVILAALSMEDSGCRPLGRQSTRGLAWVRIAAARGSWTFVSVHLHHPLIGGRRGGAVQRLARIAASTAEQLLQFSELATFLRSPMADTTVVVMGDFNAEPTWPHFRTFLDRTGLHATADSPPTWALGHIGFAIDHVLVGPGATIQDVRAGPNAGSDHRPIIARLAHGRADER